MRFVWFWTFWHWSKESFRSGAFLLSPLHGIGSHWDEWFQHEASDVEQAAIEKAGRTETSQRQFVAWLLHRWAREANLNGGKPVRRFILSQLAQVQPFNQWAAFGKYRFAYQVGGIPAVVLAENSAGNPDDVRPVEAVMLPADLTSPSIVAEGFQAESFDLETARRAAISVLRGKSFLILVGLWIASGQRSYSRSVKIVLNLGWLVLGGLILNLLLGPDPGSQLFSISAMLVVLWSALTLAALANTTAHILRAWRQGRAWSEQLERGQIRLRMIGGLTLKGGSAGLPFCLNTLLSLHRMNASADRSWFWERILHRSDRVAAQWAATGVITADGYLKPVVLEAKLRACLQNGITEHILTPRQSGAGRQVIGRVAETITPYRKETTPAPPGNLRLGFAAESHRLELHPCRHIAQALMRLSGLSSRSQTLVNCLGIAISITMLWALSDLRGILAPPPAPMVVNPSSPSPDYLWVSLDTKRPECFLVVLDSRYWRNRRAEITFRSGAKASTRAEIHLVRSASFGHDGPEDGVVWIERRRRFLNREFTAGERVGRYELSYLNTLGHE